MSRNSSGLLSDRDEVKDLPDCADQDTELTDDDLDDVSGGDDGWGTGTPPPPTDGG